MDLNLEFIESYTIDRSRLLGKGITSEVFFGYNTITKEEVAIKIIPKNIKNIKFYVYNEISNLKILKSQPNIISLLDHFETQTSYILIFEYIELTLKKYIEKGISNKIKKDIMLQLISISEVLQKNNIIHHDIKPDNILVKINEETIRVQIKLCDFGMSLVISKCSHRKLCGSPIYMHPTKLLYNYNFNSDEWSICIIFYEIVYGYNPYKGTKTRTELVNKIYKNIISYPTTNIFTPILMNLFRFNGTIFMSTIKKNIQKLEIIEIEKEIEDEIEKEIEIEIEDEIEYVFV